MTPAPQSHFFTAADGLKLHALHFAPTDDRGRLPLVCLPGLTRPAADFSRLGAALAGSEMAPRRVVAFDYRGRGQSEHDVDWHRYDLETERADILAGMAILGIERAHFFGTSRGGLHIMAMAAGHRPLIAGVVLNDIGPVLEAEGLARIKSYVGRPATPRSLHEAVETLKAGAGRTFTGLSDADWLFFATTTFGDDPDDLRTRYDPALSRTLDDFDLDAPLPEFWASFDRLSGAPVLVIRGESSDLLSGATFSAMTNRWPGVEALTVAGQGHAPLLTKSDLLGSIERFLIDADP